MRMKEFEGVLLLRFQNNSDWIKPHITVRYQNQETSSSHELHPSQSKSEEELVPGTFSLFANGNGSAGEHVIIELREGDQLVGQSRMKLSSLMKGDLSQKDFTNVITTKGQLATSQNHTLFHEDKPCGQLNVLTEVTTCEIMSFEGGDDNEEDGNGCKYAAYCCCGCMACCACTSLAGFAGANLAYIYYMANPMKLISLFF